MYMRVASTSDAPAATACRRTTLLVTSLAVVRDAYAETVHSVPTARLFVAVDPPRAVREQLAAWARIAVREMSRHSGAPPRLLDAELLHVTILFLGNRPVGKIESVATELRACGGPIGELSVGAPLWLPPRRPRALAVELHDEHGRLGSVRESVVAALGESGGSRAAAARRTPSKHHHFHPHITVARMRSNTAPRDRTLPPTPALSFQPSEMILYRSWLSSEGASYEPLASYPIR
jgi:RNA 2',3'-cyclic 3'-phosphodiesterase